MVISPPLKAVIVALPIGAWLVRSDGGLGHTLALAAGFALLTVAWIVFSPRPEAVAEPQPAAQQECCEHRHGTGEHRIVRPPTGRGARDARCPASSATARARRSTRR